MTTLILKGVEYAVLPLEELLQLKHRAGSRLPRLRQSSADGTYAANEALRAIYAAKLAESRRAIGLSQSDLARRAGVRPETINRLENGKHTPDTATLAKIERAVSQAERRFHSKRRANT